MNVEIGAEAALFPEKEYINGIAVAVQPTLKSYDLSRGIIFFLLYTKARNFSAPIQFTAYSVMSFS